MEKLVEQMNAAAAREGAEYAAINARAAEMGEKIAQLTKDRDVPNAHGLACAWARALIGLLGG